MAKPLGRGLEQYNIVRRVYRDIMKSGLIPVAPQKVDKRTGKVYQTTNGAGHGFQPGHLKNNAVIMTKNGVLFDGNIAPYIKYLEEGTSPFMVFNGFGRQPTYDAQAKEVRNNGAVFLNPGQDKHQYFISRDLFGIAAQSVASYYKKGSNEVTVRRGR